MLKTEQDGKPIVWKGHLCEGEQIIPNYFGTFILWTRCGEHDVPANKAKAGRLEDVHCSACIEVYRAPRCSRCQEQSTELDFNGYCPTCHDDMTPDARGES